MIEKIKNALKTEYANMGLGDKAFDGVASFLVKTIENEEGIDGVINSEDTRNLLKAFQGESDSLRNRAAQLQKDFDAYKKSHPNKEGNGEGGEVHHEDQASKELLEKLNDITRRLDERDAKERKSTILAAAKASAKMLGCTDERAIRLTERMFSVKDDESAEDAAKRFKDEYNANVKEFFGDGPRPNRGNVGDIENDEKAFHKMLSGYAESKGLGETNK